MPLVESGAQADTFVPVILSGVQNNLVIGPRDWVSRPALHFWCSFSEFKMWDSTNENWLVNYGWILQQTVTMTFGVGTDDFLEEGVFAPNYVTLKDDLDLITSPFIFASGEHVNFLRQLLGFVPRRMLMECLIRFPDVHVSGALPRMGFSAPARIEKNADNFRLGNGSGVVNIASSDEVGHLFKMRIEDKVYVSMDGGTEVNVTLDTGVWPTGWGAQAGGDGGDVDIAWVHIWYE